MLASEKHFRAVELARLWGISDDTVRRIFSAEEGVIKLGHRDRKNKRRYARLLIPASVAERVHARLHGKLAA